MVAYPCTGLPPPSGPPKQAKPILRPYPTRAFFSRRSTPTHGGDGVEPTRRHNLRPRAHCLLVVLVDHVHHPKRFAGEVTVMHASSRTGGNKLTPVLYVWPNRGDNDLAEEYHENQSGGMPAPHLLAAAHLSQRHILYVDGEQGVRNTPHPSKTRCTASVISRTW